jgi:Domain of unknown function (DUF4169)
MGDVVNLNKARKKHNRAQAARQAAESRIRHGRKGAQKVKERDEARRIRQSLDAKRLDKD